MINHADEIYKLTKQQGLMLPHENNTLTFGIDHYFSDIFSDKVLWWNYNSYSESYCMLLLFFLLSMKQLRSKKSSSILKPNLIIFTYSI